MSFFDNNKNVGLCLIVIGVLSLIAGLANVAISGFEGWAIAYAISALITGVLILLYGLKVLGGGNDKVAIVSGLIRTIGLATILSAIFRAVGDYLLTDSLGTGVASVVISIIVGLIYLWIAAKVAGANKNAISKIVWIVLIIITLLGILGSISTIFAGGLENILLGIAWLIVYVYVLIAAFSNEIKRSMGV